MEVRIASTHSSLSGGAWYVGRVGSYHFEALVFAEPSQYGIGGGQVSKLYLWDGPKKRHSQVVAVYERGWELEPKEDLRVVVETLVAELSRRAQAGRQAGE
jgi:hypothetical protein